MSDFKSNEAWEIVSKVGEMDRKITRLQAALQQIVDEIPIGDPGAWAHHHHYRFIAEQALKGTDDGAK